MATDKLIYASAARRAILREEPRLAYCIDNIKGVEAVEVVRCRECGLYGDGRYNQHYCTLSGIPTDGDDFCSYGERVGEDGK